MTKSYIEGEGRALRGGVVDPVRMKELTNGYPAYARRSYPCPKPVGELIANLPIDQPSLQDLRDLLAPISSQAIVFRYPGES